MKTYSGQLKRYAMALERLWGRPVTRACVVFLHRRTVREVRLD
jgi:hypothetical protein